MVPIKRIKDHFYYKDLEKYQQTAQPRDGHNETRKIIFILPEKALLLKDAFYEFSREWNDGTDQPRLVVFGTAAQSPDLDDDNVVYLVKKDIDWKGVANKEKTKALMDSRFDLLINMDDGGLRPMEHLSAAIPAHLKIGLRETKHKIYDILVETDSTDMLHNLRAINQILGNLQS